jgi:PadR family transcriptional regulator PadR
VLTTLLETSEPLYGLQIAETTGLMSGSIYPILSRLETEGLIKGQWEELDEVAAKRRRRRYYELTRSGVQFTNDAIARRPERSAAVRKGLKWRF